MKAVVGLLVLICSLTFFAGDANAQNMSYGGCYAYTACNRSTPFTPAFISCQTYGSAYIYGPGYTSQACQWSVIPGYSVYCAGYVQSVDAWGNTVWGWNVFNYSCY